MNLKLAILSGLLAFGASGALYSTIKDQIHDVSTTATLKARDSQCTVEYQLASEIKKTFKEMSCGEAARFQQDVGADKVKLDRSEVVILQYAGPDGVSREARLAASAIPAAAAPGDQFAMMVDPAHPERLRNPVGLAEVGILLALIFGSATASAFGLGLRPRQLAFGRATAAAAPARAPGRRLAESGASSFGRRRSA